MRAERRSDDLADPGAAGWADAETVTVALGPIALEAQPTEYIRVKWADRPYGTVREVRVAAAHDGRRLAVRLEWEDSATPNTEFPDAGAVYFPAGGDAPVATVGAPDAPVHLWYWQADLADAKRLEGRGPGAFRPTGTNGVAAAAALDGGRWAVVLTGELSDAVTDGHTRVGVAVWDGANEERAGLGAVSSEWIPLEVV